MNEGYKKRVRNQHILQDKFSNHRLVRNSQGEGIHHMLLYADVDEPGLSTGVLRLHLSDPCIAQR